VILMTEVIPLPLSGYAFLRGQSHPFSHGVACLKGYALTRVRFRTPPPLAEGLARASSFIQAQGRSPSALAACELRSPAPMSLSDFAAFNRNYVDLLRANGFPAEPPYPMARSNVAPIYDPPPTNTLFAFTYASAAAETDAHTRPDFLISGRAELIDDPRSVVAEGDSSSSGTERKAAHVFEQLRVRVKELGCAWTDITGIQVYTTRPIEPILPLMKRLGLVNVGTSLNPAHPPVAPFEFEADVRSVSIERML
jgi:hypothetical protein